MFESVEAAKFCTRLDELLKHYGVTDEEYMRNVLTRIPESQIWNAEWAEREIRKYRRERKAVNAASS